MISNNKSNAAHNFPEVFMKTVCGIDLGTQSCKIIIYDYENKKVLDTSQIPIERRGFAFSNNQAKG
jgi:ribulose kinase